MPDVALAEFDFARLKIGAIPRGASLDHAQGLPLPDIDLLVILPSRLRATLRWEPGHEPHSVGGNRANLRAPGANEHAVQALSPCSTGLPGEFAMIPLLAQTVTAAGQVQGYALGWGTLSLINAGLAQSKNHSGLPWWFISLLLGPIATFIIVVFLEKPASVPGKPNIDSSFREFA